MNCSKEKIPIARKNKSLFALYMALQSSCQRSDKIVQNTSTENTSRIDIHIMVTYSDFSGYSLFNQNNHTHEE
jgi:hypothetical protein